MSIEKVNVEQKLAQIKAMGGDKNKIDSAQEQFQLSVFYNEVNYLNPRKYSAEDRKKVNKCMEETLTDGIVKAVDHNNKNLKKIIDLSVKNGGYDKKKKLMKEMLELVKANDLSLKQSLGILDDIEQLNK